MAILTPDQGNVDLGRSRITPTDTYVRPGVGDTGGGLAELSKSLSRLGVDFGELADKNKQTDEQLEQQKIPGYVAQFSQELEMGVVDEVEIGKRLNTSSKIIVAKVVEGIGARQYEDHARSRMEEALRNDPELRLDPAKRKAFFDSIRKEATEATKNRAFYASGASRGLEGVINEYESGFQREGAAYFQKEQERDFTKKAGKAFLTTRAGAGAGENGALLDFIAGPESGGNYNAYYGNGGNTTTKFTEMTVAQVQAWQRNAVAKGSPSAAVGRYQFITSTLGGLIKELGIDPNAKFDEALQDKLGVALLKRRGLDDYRSGKITKEQFANKLAQEWAGLPMVSGYKAGKSFYDGDGLNKSGVDVNAFLAAIDVKGGSPDPVAAVDAGGKGIPMARRRELIVNSAIETTMATGDVAALDRIPKELRGVPEDEKKIEAARTYAVTKQRQERDDAWKLQDRSRVEETRNAEKIVTRALMAGAEFTADELETLTRINPDLVTGMPARRQAIANLRPQDENKKYEDVRTKMRQAILENKDPRHVSSHSIFDPRLQEESRKFADELVKTGGELSNNYYTERWAEDAKNNYRYLFGNPSVDIKADPQARQRQNDFEEQLHYALLDYSEKNNGRLPLTKLDRSAVYNTAITSVLKIWPPQAEQAAALLNKPSPSGGTSVGTGQKGVPVDERTKRIQERSKTLYPD